ncbi:hypothetical protein AAFX91_41715 [Bradyrhizobium sp. 31Argb]|uniref:hypothetical protein n=1 Tax=Bradyrhizobium TaxID=374 RepID=UPI0004836B57|nr:hypothetical protein [Bradyrhizobium elkanii]
MFSEVMEMMKRPADHDTRLAWLLTLAVLASYLALATLFVEQSYDVDGPKEHSVPKDTAEPSSLRYLCLVLCRASTAQFENGPSPGQPQSDTAAKLELTAMPTGCEALDCAHEN